LISIVRTKKSEISHNLLLFAIPVNSKSEARNPTQILNSNIPITKTVLSCAAIYSRHLILFRISSFVLRIFVPPIKDLSEYKMHMHKNSAIMTIEGHLERITYFNEATHYTIARLKPSNLDTVVTVVGYMAGVSPGETIKIKGRWETHPRFGQQFKIQSFEVTLPAAADGIKKYLASGIIKGIGPSLAARMVEMFGTDTLEIIENNPGRLLEVEGIGEAKAAMIQSAWLEHHTLRNLMQFLQEMGVQTSYCGKIYKAYGPDAVDLIREDPYILADDIPGAGFLIADTIARKLGMENEDPERVRACILHLILQNAEDGHTFAEAENLIARCENQFQISRLTIENTIAEMAAANAIVVEPFDNEQATSAIFMKDLHRAETGLANRLKAMLSVPTEIAEINADRIAAEATNWPSSCHRSSWKFSSRFFPTGLPSSRAGPEPVKQPCCVPSAPYLKPWASAWYWLPPPAGLRGAWQR